MAFYTLESEVKFKKYRDMGLSLKEVIDTDLDYVKWLYRNKVMKLDKTAFDYLCEKAGRPQRQGNGKKHWMK